MATIEAKIMQLHKKISAKQKKLASNEIILKAAKSSIKALKKDISDLECEVSQLQLQQLSDTLSEKGITAADIEEAIAAGIFEKPAPKNSEEVKTSHEISNS